MDNKIFFGLVRIPRKSIYDELEYELYLINDSDRPVTITRKAFGGFKTCDDDVVAMSKPQDNDVNITVEPHSHVFYCAMSEGSFDGAGQCRAYAEIEGSSKMLEFYTSSGAGFMGSLIPCLNKYGRVIHPQVRDIVDTFKAEHEIHGRDALHSFDVEDGRLAD